MTSNQTGRIFTGFDEQASRSLITDLQRKLNIGRIICSLKIVTISYKPNANLLFLFTDPENYKIILFAISF